MDPHPSTRQLKAAVTHHPPTPVLRPSSWTTPALSKSPLFGCSNPLATLVILHQTHPSMVASFLCWGDKTGSNALGVTSVQAEGKNHCCSLRSCWHSLNATALHHCKALLLTQVQLLCQDTKAHLCKAASHPVISQPLILHSPMHMQAWQFAFTELWDVPVSHLSSPSLQQLAADPFSPLSRLWERC